MNTFGLPKKFIVFDLEWTAWEGSQDRNWSGPNEHREVYDIGAVRVAGEKFDAKATFRQLVTLEIVPRLPRFSEQLTGITQDDIDRDGISFARALTKFDAFTKGYELFNWGVGDRLAIEESCRLKKLDNPFIDRIHDIRQVFRDNGIRADKYKSSTVVEAFGQKNRRTSHQGLDDALNIVEALRLLQKKVG